MTVSEEEIYDDDNSCFILIVVSIFKYAYLNELKLYSMQFYYAHLLWCMCSLRLTVSYITLLKNKE
jgi:hypothetical protein